MRRSSTRAAGLLILILGIWGGLVPFVGPYFHFAMGPTKSWTWTTGRLWLDVLPGAVAALGGLMLLTAGPRLAGKLGALLALAAGLWFAIGPDVSLLWNAGGAQGAAHGSTFVRVLEMLTYHTLLGAVIAALAGYALPGSLTRRAAADAEEAEAETRAPGAAMAGAGATRHPLTTSRTTAAPGAGAAADDTAVTRQQRPVRDEEPVVARSATAAGPATADEPTEVVPGRDGNEPRTAVIDRPAPRDRADGSGADGGAADAPAAMGQTPAVGSGSNGAETSDAPAAAGASAGSPGPVTVRRRRGGLLSRLRR